jgi:hypothetical protein
MIDDVLIGTFPASDPPAWTPGMARPAPAPAERRADDRSPQSGTDSRTDIIDVSRTDPERTFAQAIGSWAGAAGLAVLAGFAFAAVGMSLVAGVRGVLAIAQRFVALVW